ncbi:Uncharacterised protein [uncultured archaeon]|nr:Uncharacterised protein [uncultured archaeon]
MPINRKKGQAFASDFVISAVLFIIILAISIEMWTATGLKYSKSESSDFMQKKAFSITDTLIKTQGYPLDWTRNSAKVIGVSGETPQVLNKSKLIEMKYISDSDLKNTWGISGYNVYMKFTNSSGNIISLDGTALEYGIVPFQQKDLVPLKRLVLINDSGNLIRSVLTFLIWR